MQHDTKSIDNVTIAAIQMCSTSDKEQNYATCERLIRTAVSNISLNSPVKLVCLPECFFFIGESLTQSMNAAETLTDSNIIMRFCNLAKELEVWLSLGGFQERGYYRVPTSTHDEQASDATPDDPPAESTAGQPAEQPHERITNAHIVISPEGKLDPSHIYRKVSRQST